jgi:hypothetical protein
MPEESPKQGLFHPSARRVTIAPTLLSSMRKRFSLLAFLLAACASQGQQVYVAPTNDSVSTTTEEGLGNTPVHNIYVINASTEPITVFGVALQDCENVKEQCEPHRVDISIGGGQRRAVLHVEPRNTGLAFSYRFSYSWRPSKAAPALP